MRHDENNKSVREECPLRTMPILPSNVLSGIGTTLLLIIFVWYFVCVVLELSTSFPSFFRCLPSYVFSLALLLPHLCFFVSSYFILFLFCFSLIHSFTPSLRHHPSILYLFFFVNHSFRHCDSSAFAFLTILHKLIEEKVRERWERDASLKMSNFTHPPLKNNWTPISLSKHTSTTFPFRMISFPHHHRYSYSSSSSSCFAFFPSPAHCCSFPGQNCTFIIITFSPILVPSSPLNCLQRHWSSHQLVSFFGFLQLPPP